jgi:hypothetical protein
MDMLALLRRAIHDRMVLLSDFSLDEQLVEVALEFAGSRKNDQPSHFRVQTLSNKERHIQSSA